MAMTKALLVQDVSGSMMTGLLAHLMPTALKALEGYGYIRFGTLIDG